MTGYQHFAFTTFFPPISLFYTSNYSKHEQHLLTSLLVFMLFLSVSKAKYHINRPTQQKKKKKRLLLVNYAHSGMFHATDAEQRPVSRFPPTEKGPLGSCRGWECQAPLVLCNYCRLQAQWATLAEPPANTLVIRKTPVQTCNFLFTHVEEDHAKQDMCSLWHVHVRRLFAMQLKKRPYVVDIKSKWFYCIKPSKVIPILLCRPQITNR